MKILAGGIEAPTKEPSTMFYAGVGLGTSNASYEVNDDSLVKPNLGFIQKLNPATHNINKNSFLGNIFLGAGIPLIWFYIGAEISTDLSGDRATGESSSYHFQDDKGTVENLSSVNTYKLKTFVFNLDVLPGVFLSPRDLLYFRLGAAWARLKITTDTSLLEVDPAPSNPSFVKSVTKNVTGLRLGGGLMHKFSHRMAFWVGYVATLYGSKGATHSLNYASSATTTGTLSTTTSGKTTTQTFLLSLSLLLGSQS